MSGRRYPYRLYYERRRQGEVEPVLRPTVTFTASYYGRAWTTDALIDTGSPVSLFTRKLADSIGIEFDLAGDERREFFVAGGRHVAFKFPIRLALDPISEMAWNGFGWFFYEDWDLRPPVGAIFGSEGFFDEWAVNFVRRYNYFSVERSAMT